MKKSILMLLTVIISMTANAQLNAQKGYIITNENDTLRGVIDYRSDSRNAKECHILLEGEQEYKTYKPGEIAGYGLENGGVYYVTRDFYINNTEKKMFAEFLLKGSISLYRHVDGVSEYYIFVNKDGETAVMESDKGNYTYNSNDEYVQAKRARMSDAAKMFNKSSATVEKLWKSEYKIKRIVSLTREYDENYCSEDGKCIQYQYDAKNSAHTKLVFFAEAGASCGMIKAGGMGNVRNWKANCFVPQIGLGFDVMLPRYSKGLSIQAELLMSHWNASKDNPDVVTPDGTKKSSIKFTYGEIDLGMKYNFLTTFKVSPFIRGGILVCQSIGMHTKNLDPYYIAGQNVGGTLGWYAGLGTDVSVGKHRMRVSANYSYRKHSHRELTASSAGVNIAFAL